MIAVIQRISSASVSVDGKVTGNALKGMMILVGFAADDTQEDADVVCAKISGLRIFTDENDKMNLSIGDIDGQILLIPNFTLTASCRRGRRPDFGNSLNPCDAKALFNYSIDKLKEYGLKVETGVFGADMKIRMDGDGPVTIILDSKTLKTPRNS